MQVFSENFQNYEELEKKKKADEIWNEYIDMELATSQICFNDDLYDQIATALKSDKITADVFQPMLKVPETTLERDIFPRFVKSKYYNEMTALLECPIKEYIKEYDQNSSIITYFPEDSVPNFSTTILFSLEEIMKDSFLSFEFIEWLKKRHMVSKFIFLFKCTNT